MRVAKFKEKSFSCICNDCGKIIRCKKTNIKHHYCEKCWGITENQKHYWTPEKRREKRKKIFCELTGMSREKYFELKKFMGIGGENYSKSIRKGKKT
jgi:hypothetical protein